MSPRPPRSASPSSTSLAAPADPPRPADASAPWHRLTTAETLTALGSSTDGLDPDEAERRRAEHGPNQLEERGGTSPWRLVWDSSRP